MATPITIARGDGIGPEIMDATLNILQAAGAQLDIEEIQIGEKIYLSGNTSGIEESSWDSLRRTKVFLKAPITTPQGGGVKSLNVTVRKTLGLYANVRPCVSYHPFVKTNHPTMDVVIFRENEEDLYAGIEHRQTDEVVQCLKLISRPGTEKICRYAFEYAKANNRKHITCMSKDNIMKLSDGLFHSVFDEVAKEYPDIKTNHMIIDIGMAKMANCPDMFDVVVLPNLYGDIISDVAAEITGSVGLVPSINIGDQVAMFEAIHGSAPDIAGKDMANPSALLLSAVTMLTHIGQVDVAQKVHNAWLRTIEDGIHTGDIFKEGLSKEKVGTSAFAEAVVKRLGQEPQQFPKVQLKNETIHLPEYKRPAPAKKELVGVDVFIDWAKGKAQELGDHLNQSSNDELKLLLITNRGVRVWPNGFDETFCTDHWRCRFVPSKEGAAVTPQMIIDLLGRIQELGLDFIKTEHLYHFDGKKGYSLAQGQ